MLMYPDYLLLVLLPSLVLGGVATMLTRSTFRKYSEVGSRRGYSGARAAAEMLRRYGVHGVTIEPVRGMLTDHYDPLSRTLRLSEGVYQSRSLAAVGIACHEAGHAIQHARSFAPMWLRSALVPVTNLCTSFYILPILLGFAVPALGYLGLAMCGMGLLFALVTLPVEWDASRRAKIAMDAVGLLDREESAAAGRVLNAAFLTYVAAVASALLTLLYWAMRLGLFGGRD